MDDPHITIRDAGHFAALVAVIAALLLAPLAVASGLSRSGWPYSVALLMIPR